MRFQRKLLIIFFIIFKICHVVRPCILYADIYTRCFFAISTIPCKKVDIVFFIYNIKRNLFQHFRYLQYLFHSKLTKYDIRFFITFSPDAHFLCFVCFLLQFPNRIFKRLTFKQPLIFRSRIRKHCSYEIFHIPGFGNTFRHSSANCLVKNTLFYPS